MDISVEPVTELIGVNITIKLDEDEASQFLHNYGETGTDGLMQYDAVCIQLAQQIGKVFE